ncbi:hypothetical protein DNTS_005284, partial [Danionella cerebrum]
NVPCRGLRVASISSLPREGEGLEPALVVWRALVSAAATFQTDASSCAIMKGLGPNRGRHLSDSCDPCAGPQEPLCALMPPDPHPPPFLFTPSVSHYGTLDPHLQHFPASSAPGECLVPLNNTLSSSSTFPRLSYGSPAENSAYAQGCVPSAGSRSNTLTSSMSMGLGLGLAAPAMITSGTATISSAAAAKMNRLPANLLEQLERHLPLQRDGFSTLQFHRRSRSGGAKQRSESPSRIRNLVQSVQKLFNKSQSLEVSAVKANMGSSGGGDGGAGDAPKTSRRSKSKDRAKTEGTKRRARPTLSGFWSSDDGLEDDQPPQPSPGPLAVAYRNPLSMMTLGRAVSDSQAVPRTIPQGYNTIATHSLKTSRSSAELDPPAPGHTTLAKRASWATLSLSQARQVLQKSSDNVNRTLTKSKSCHGHQMSANFLQVPSGDWSGSLGRSAGSPGEIPCRRMRSGSYVKAMGDLEDSEDSDGPPSPKPSPKSAARRQSYLKATQHSLSEQQPPLPPRNCLPSLCEVPTNRSLDNLDCLMSAGDAALQHWDACCGSLARGAALSQVEQSLMGGASYVLLESHTVEALDLPTPSCFRSRSHSYLRAIQAGCSQDDDTASVDSDETPPITSSISSCNSATVSTCTAVCKKTPPPVPPRNASKPFISVTVQSSTESAQDTYLDSQDQRSEANSQSGRSNSSDSLASSRTGSLPKGTKRPPIPALREPVQLPSARVTTPPSTIAPPHSAIAPPFPSSDATTEPVSLTLAPGEPQAAPKRKLSSIGIQVDCVQPPLKEEIAPSTRFQSIGVQVEDGRPLSRFTSMASRQETTETESQDQSEGKKPSELQDPLDPSSLPPPDPSLQSSSGGSLNGADPSLQISGGLRDGRCFQKLLQAETQRMESWCQQMEEETKDKRISEEVLGKVRSAVGSAQLLMSQKFQQFQGLCEQNLDVNAQPRPTAQDLAGFWDLLQLSIEDISMKFDELHLLRDNDWKSTQSPQTKEEKKSGPAHTPKKTVKAKPSGVKEKSVDSVADKQRQEARKRLMAAKRAVSERQNSATESAESIEIYVPEAQTRL